MLKKKLFGIMTLFVGLMLVMVLTITFTTCDNGTTSCSHSWGSWKITTPPTALPITGQETRTCSKCSKSETRSLTEANFKTYFFGTWFMQGNLQNPSQTYDSTIFIDSNNMNREDTDARYFNFTITTWTTFANTRDTAPTSNLVFPIGFKLDGTLTANNKFTAFTTYHVFLHTNGQRLAVAGSAGITSPRIWIKQEN